MQNYVLKISCEDQKGLVHKITGLLFKYDFNVLETAEFVERNSNHFFMRSQAIGQEGIEIVEELQKIVSSNAQIIWKAQHKKKIVVLATKEYHCLGDLLLRNRFDALNAEILAVVSNHAVLKDLVEKFDIPFHFLDHEAYQRSEHEQEVIKIIQSYEPEYVVLAKYMRVLSADFVQCFEGQIINIHHSFLPAFIGANPYRQAYERGVKVIGATAHFVNSDLDEGPIISQDVSYVDHKRTPKELTQAGRYLEVSVLSKALQLVFDDRVFVHSNKTIIFD